jgi:hypothetical protein
MKDSDFFADVARSAKRASGRSPAESRAIRDAIWPGGMPVDYKPQYPALLTTHLPDDQAFFERLSWPMVDAIWMLSTGEGPTDNPSEERLTFGRALKGESDDWSGRKPHKRASHRIERRVLDAYQYWLAAHSIFTARSAVNELFGVAQFEGELLVPQPIHFHEWIRWTQLFKLPVARRFWDAYYAWKASAWASGTQMAWLGTWRDASWWPVLYGPVPSELTWRIPYSEDLQVMMQTEAPARFINGWKMSSEQVLQVAEQADLIHLLKRRNLSLSPGSRTHTVGAPLQERVGAAVSALAAAYELAPERDGRYFFGVEQRLLMLWLIDVDPGLADCSPHSISVALPGLVRGKPSDGRPSRL